MILIDNKFSNKFIAKYSTNITVLLNNTLYPAYLKANNVPIAFQDFYTANLNDIIIGTPDKLKHIADDLFLTFPIIEETYQPKKFYSGYPSSLRRIVAQMAHLKLNKKDDKKKFTLLASKLLPILESFIKSKRSHCLPGLLSIITASKSLREQSDIYALIYSLVRGRATVTSGIPDWVKNLSSLFDYSKISANLLFDLCSNINIAVCPMCNESNIEVIHKGKHRPVLDHFFAKSRHPLFGMSLYNLIPCCDTCNSTFKRDFETWYPYHANPYQQGVGSTPLFNLKAFTTASLYQGGRLQNKANNKINIIPQHNDIDNNMRLLKTELVYNRSVPLQKLSHLLAVIGQYQNGMYPKHSVDAVLELFDYDNARHALADPYRKLKYDTINAFLPAFVVKF